MSKNGSIKDIINGTISGVLVLIIGELFKIFIKVSFFKIDFLAALTQSFLFIKNNPLVIIILIMAFGLFGAIINIYKLKKIQKKLNLMINKSRHYQDK